ncbi:LysR family transcriptional regulator [Spirillospora sp. NPDC000708]|uniref:LysR family transcriptional regulator n=1 Tax=Actinomadura nitritigenes TaxID=134602 RepID=UPI00335EAB79
MLDPVRLMLLCELADRGTMTAVAAACGYTSSAVSQQLAVLEREAGVALLERDGRRVKLTHEGRRLVAHARIVLSALETAERDLRSADVPRGPIDVACFSTFASVHVVPALAAARERYHELGIRLHELEPPEGISALRARRCEVAVCYSYNLTPSPPPEELTVHPLVTEPILVALPTDPSGILQVERGRADRQGITLDRLTDAEWIVGSREGGSTALIRRACALAGFAPQITHAVDNYELVLRMVAHGLGVALVPLLAAEAYGLAPGVTLCEISDVELTRSIFALTHTLSGTRPAVDAVLNLLGSTN